MRISCLLCAWNVFVAVNGFVGAADLTTIDRTIKKEPVYRTGKPNYCLLVFGPEAKTRVWLVQDGDKLDLRGTKPSMPNT